MKCKCGKRVEKVFVEIEGADNRAVSYQCPSGHVEFEKESAAKVVKELKFED